MGEDVSLTEARAKALAELLATDERIRQERFLEVLSAVHDPIAEEALRIIKLQAQRIKELESDVRAAERHYEYWKRKWGMRGIEIDALKEEVAALNREKAEAWGIRFCCNRDDCNCQGQPTDPPSWWFDAQELRSILDSLGAMKGIPARQDNQPDSNYVINVVATLRATADLVERARQHLELALSDDTNLAEGVAQVCLALDALPESPGVPTADAEEKEGM